ncbi:MAG: Ig-like domain-containing protein [Acidobacteriota bacterium]
MLRLKSAMAVFFIAALLLTSIPFASAQQASDKTAEISPASSQAEIGQQVKLKALIKDKNGNATEQAASAWFAVPFDVASIDETGTVTLYNAGVARIGAIVGGKLAWATITVKPARVSRVDIDKLQSPLVVGGAVKLSATARAENGTPRANVMFKWESENPSVAAIDAAGLVTGVSSGQARIRAVVGDTKGELLVQVVASPVQSLSIEPRSALARTGDVIRFRALANGEGEAAVSPLARWSVSGAGAMIEDDGAFVAERPGTYIVTAQCGKATALASVVVSPRNAEREVEIIGRALPKDIQTAEQWIFGNYAYLSSIADRLMVYDISDPSKPRLTDTIKVDARITNDISVTADGKIGVMSREGASNRKNGIVFFDTSDPAHPRIISEYTATVTGGVHSAFVDKHYVYLTDDATGSMRVIDFRDVKNPKEVARWEVKNPLAKTQRSPDGEVSSAGRYLHDVQVLDGLAYLAYWRDGLVILDVGAGIRGGSPENPQFVSQFRFNHNELYGAGWLAGAHAVFRYKNYVFVGDEVFPDQFNIQGRERFPVRGIVHVIDVSDIASPRKVAEYEVPEGGAHNIWVKDDILYMGYYSGGGRIVDVAGELRGDLYRQGREIARLWTGDPNGFRPNQPFTWGAQPAGDKVFFNDINSGLWIVKLGKPKDKGSTSAPGN